MREFIKITKREVGKTGIEWNVENHKGELLGKIEMERKWKELVFVPYDCTIYSSGCLKEIINVMENCKKTYQNNSPIPIVGASQRRFLNRV